MGLAYLRQCAENGDRYVAWVFRVGIEKEGKAFNRKARKGTSAKIAKRSRKAQTIKDELLDALH